jgi:transposase-like protein
MSTRKNTKPAERKAIVERFLASGQKREEFAAAEGLTKSTLDRWLSQVRPSKKMGELYAPTFEEEKAKRKKRKTKRARQREADAVGNVLTTLSPVVKAASCFPKGADAVVAAAVPSKLVRRFVHAVLECGTLGEAREAFKLAVGKIERLRK